MLYMRTIAHVLYKYVLGYKHRLADYAPLFDEILMTRSLARVLSGNDDANIHDIDD